ncbi:hypothetical protein COT42_08785 [Candidatus Saganbacteria bacterium CG08_land_8_20_14_0_20_45_16]|uniref:HD domain-containing protein n=1 Tax=Candidatus Saganbacteria bacterium CG08_land_8_20_14_0_20_45_16 TaxID=2014293 RepID=A0A2H0XTD0_UNCSA|nr:MAG: hypothetical protein COT42_08785 [Candidatus Saganbacteria bacterium CG08_land_8_20_14_0_20_45_16]
MVRLCEGRNIATELIEKADVLMVEAHHVAKRDSGEAYHFHPRAVAFNLIVEFGIKDENMICAALLHDIIEDAPLTREFIVQEFNEDIADLVDGVTKLSKALGEARGRENLKKINCGLGPRPMGSDS